MRWIKLLFISATILFVLLTTIAALLPSEVRISRAVDINNNADKIYPQVASLQNWADWNVYVQKMDKKDLYQDSISGKAMTIVMKGRKKDLLLTEWRQEKLEKFNGGFRLIEHGKSTTVQWYFDFHFKWYPWEKFSSIVYDAQVGPVMESSLMNLKSITEDVR